MDYTAGAVKNRMRSRRVKPLQAIDAKIHTFITTDSFAQSFNMNNRQRGVIRHPLLVIYFYIHFDFSN